MEQIKIKEEHIPYIEERLASADTTKEKIEEILLKRSDLEKELNDLKERGSHNHDAMWGFIHVNYPEAKGNLHLDRDTLTVRQMNEDDMSEIREKILEDSPVGRDLVEKLIKSLLA